MSRLILLISIHRKISGRSGSVIASMKEQMKPGHVFDEQLEVDSHEEIHLQMHSRRATCSIRRTVDGNHINPAGVQRVLAASPARMV